MSWHKVAGGQWGTDDARWFLEYEFGHPASNPQHHPVEWVDWVADRISSTFIDRHDLDPTGLMIQAQAWAEEVIDQWTLLWDEDDAPAEEDEEEEYNFETELPLPECQYGEAQGDAPVEDAEDDVENPQDADFSEQAYGDAPMEDATDQEIFDTLTFYEFLTSEPAMKKQRSTAYADDPAYTPPDNEEESYN